MGRRTRSNRRAQAQKPFNQPKVRNLDIVEMRQRDAGAMGGGKRQRNRRDRQAFKIDLRRGEYV